MSQLKYIAGRPQCNEHLVRDLMNYSPFGAISQMIVMQAISQYVEEVKDADPREFHNAFMHGAAWVGAAKDIHERIEAFYNRHNDEPKADLHGLLDEARTQLQSIADSPDQVDCDDVRELIENIDEAIGEAE